MSQSLSSRPAYISGHLYPVNEVAAWTKQLQIYNNELDYIIELLDEIDPLRWFIEFIAESVQQACQWINFWLAELRYQIIRALRAIYKKVTEVISIYAPLVNPPTSINDVISWLGNVATVLGGPYAKLVQFVIDFTTYTPPLINAATTLVSNCATITAQVTSKCATILSQCAQIPSEAAAAALANASIHFDGISLAEITGGSEPTPPQPPTVKPLIDWKRTTVYKSNAEQISKTKEWYALQRKIRQAEDRAVMPAATADLVGIIYRYIGNTTPEFTYNNYYKCINTGTNYAWQRTTI